MANMDTVIEGAPRSQTPHRLGNRRRCYALVADGRRIAGANRV